MRAVFLILSFIFCSSLKAQNTQPDTYFSKGDYAFFTIDILDNIYVLTVLDQLKKMSSKGDSLAVFNNVKNYGKLSAIDVSNPLHIVVFYKGQNKVVFLDQFLHVKNTLNLSNLGVLSASAVCLAFDGNIWVYDDFENRILRISSEGKILSTTTNFRELFNPLPTINWIRENNGLLYAYDATKGIFVFDFYGTYKNTIPIIGWENLSIHKNKIYGWHQNHIQEYDRDTKNFQSTVFPFESATIRQVEFNSNFIWILDDKGLKKIFRKDNK